MGFGFAKGDSGSQEVSAEAVDYLLVLDNPAGPLTPLFGVYGAAVQPAKLEVVLGFVAGYRAFDPSSEQLGKPEAS